MKYKTVVIDFPWKISFSSDSLKRDRKPIYQRPLNADELYEQMNLEEIRKFPIDEFADEESLLFMWVLNGKAEGIPTMLIALDFMNMNRFSYHGIITWYKTQGASQFSPIVNVTEHCLIGWRGNYNNLIRKNYAKMKSIIITNHQIKNSEKPAQFYQLLRKWTPSPRIDIFARQAHYGFDGWGDQYVGEGPLAQYL